MATVSLKIMMTISSNTAVRELGFSCMKREKSVLRKRLGEDILDHFFRVKTPCALVLMTGPSLDNFDTEKFVSDWIESALTSRH